MGLVDGSLNAPDSGRRLGVLRAALGTVKPSTPTTETESYQDGERYAHSACRPKKN